MKNRDKYLIKCIKKHYSELVDEFKLVNDFDGFCENKVLNKAIKMDLLQIGENINHLTNETKLMLNKRDLVGIIDIRNQVAHGYVYLEDKIIWLIISNDLPKLMEQIEVI